MTPDLPPGLPPLPPVPPGFDRWEYRGMGWESPDHCIHAVYYCDGEPWEVFSRCPKSGICGQSHYLEAVREPAKEPSAGEARVCGWRPIETAPKGVSPMIVVIGHFKDRGYTTDPWCVFWMEGTWQRWPHQDQPTHWMPLPPPPTSEDHE